MIHTDKATNVPLINLFVQVMNLIGDVKGKVAVMVDDMIDTAGKLGSIVVDASAYSTLGFF
jgi:phosphoribosylpyrophosphate synthetase